MGLLLKEPRMPEIAPLALQLYCQGRVAGLKNVTQMTTKEKKNKSKRNLEICRFKANICWSILVSS